MACTPIPHPTPPPSATDCSGLIFSNSTQLNSNSSPIPHSTISTGLNALAAIALRDFMPAKMRESMSDKRQVSCSQFKFQRSPHAHVTGIPDQDLCPLLWCSHLRRHLCHQVHLSMTKIHLYFFWLKHCTFLLLGTSFKHVLPGTSLVCWRQQLSLVGL